MDEKRWSQHGILKSPILERMAEERGIPVERLVIGRPIGRRIDRLTIIDAGSPLRSLRFELMLRQRHFVVRTCCDDDGTLAYVSEMGIDGEPRDEWSMPLDSDVLASVVRALEAALDHEEIGLQKEVNR